MVSLAQRIFDLEGRIFELEEELIELKAELFGESVADHVVTDWHGKKVRLSTLFGEHEHMILIHNMGFDCADCTMWADGFNAVLDHLEARAAFIISSPDDVERQKRGAAERGWRCRMVSTKGSDLASALGFERDGKPLPGVSTLIRSEDGTLQRYRLASFGPGDKFCPVWNLFDLLPKS